ncbi:hypothetical protein M8C21_007084, partial [Ambrosia artemisiifolia]
VVFWKLITPKMLGMVMDDWPCKSDLKQEMRVMAVACASRKGSQEMSVRLRLIVERYRRQNDS